MIWAIHESFALEEFITLNWGERGLHPDIEARFRHALAEAHTVFEAEATLELYARQLPSMRARHVHYGIDVAEITAWRATHDRDALRAEVGIAPDDVVLLCMGVIQERKAQLALVLAFADLVDRHPHARLVLVGGHPRSTASRSSRPSTTSASATASTCTPSSPTSIPGTPRPTCW